MKLKRVVSALALAVAAGPTFAAATCYGDSTLDTLGSGGTEFSANCYGWGTFSDYYTFDLAGGSDVGGQVVEWDPLNWLGVVGLDLISVSLRGGSLGSNWVTDSTLTDGFTFAELGGGGYEMRIDGSVTGWIGIGSYHGSIRTVAAAAPEPETYAMMALGLGVLAWSQRRRRLQ